MYSLSDTILSAKWTLPGKSATVEPFIATGPSSFSRVILSEISPSLFSSLFGSTPLNAVIPSITAMPSPPSPSLSVVAVDVRSTGSTYITFSDFNTFTTIDPFSVTYLSPSIGNIVIVASATAFSDGGTTFYLTPAINGTTVLGGFNDGIGKVYLADTNGSVGNVGFLYILNVQLGQLVTIELQGSANPSGQNYPLCNVSWTVSFYPSV